MSQIPFIYCLIFNYIEPLFATLGAIQALTFPSKLLEFSVPSVIYTPAMKPLFSQMAGSWLMFAFHDVVTLRVYQSPQVWKHILFAALLSDLGYTYSLVQSMGPVWFFDPRKWDVANSFAIVSTLVPLVAKVLFVCGVGLQSKEGRGEQEKKEL
ncbi:hypothetical protein B0O99DRAFT_627342 [Bisporella sp. PMI_857]|nr:hypothetical protein B0O99DRAFT_627342 [Bisporella sp. PMI_857]